MVEALPRIKEAQISSEEASLRSLSEFKRIHFLPTNEQTLEDVTRKFTMSLENNWHKKTHVFYFDGQPGTGKSYFRRKLYSHLECVQERMAEEDKKITIRQLQWDILEEELVKEKIITPEDVNKPYKPQELDVVNVYFNTLLAATLRKDKGIPWRQLHEDLVETGLLTQNPEETQKHFFERLLNTYYSLQDTFQLHFQDISQSGLVLLVEKPGATAFKYPDGIWQETERKYTPQTLDRILQGQYPFTKLNRDELYIGAIGCVGGPSMQIFGSYRNQLKKALLGPSPLKTGNELNREFGLPLFRNTAELRDHARGATPQQTWEAKIAMWELIYNLVQSNEDSFLTMLPEYIKLFMYGLHEVGYDTKLLEFITSMTDQNPEDRIAWLGLLEQINDVRNVTQKFSNGYKEADRLEARPLAHMISLCFNLAGAALLENNLDMPDVKIVLYNNPSLRAQRKRLV